MRCDALVSPGPEALPRLSNAVCRTSEPQPGAGIAMARRHGARDAKFRIPSTALPGLGNAVLGMRNFASLAFCQLSHPGMQQKARDAEFRIPSTVAKAWQCGCTH